MDCVLHFGIESLYKILSIIGVGMSSVKPKVIMIYLSAYALFEIKSGKYEVSPGEYKISPIFSPAFRGFELYILSYNHQTGIDIKEVVEKFEPDMIVYFPTDESTTPDHVKCLLPVNLGAYPEIPRILLANCDKISPLSSAGIMIGLELGAEVNFTSTIVDNEFDWLPFPSYYCPQSMWRDSGLFKDYQQKKEFCVGMFGAGYVNSGFYPWRTEVTAKVMGSFPTVFFPSLQSRLSSCENYPRITGEDYVKMVNRCQFGLACGTAARTVLAKHFEIPACHSCLLTEDTPFLRAHGFVDGENCVCVTPENVLEKIEHYLVNYEELQRITDNGYEFVNREYFSDELEYNIYKWYRLRSELKPGEKIVQTGIFDFAVVPEMDSTEYRLARGEDPIVQSWRDGFNNLQQGRIPEARDCFIRTLNYVNYEPLGRLGMALVALFSKNARNCLAFLDATFAHEKLQGGLEDYHDPVDLAYYIIASLCLGDLKRAYGVSRMWLNHTHHALQAARMIAASAVKEPFCKESEKDAVSVFSRCPVKISSVDGWLAHFRDVFKIYGIEM